MNIVRPSHVLNRSLNVRLLLFAATSIAVALAVAWGVFGLLFERHSERQLQAELEHHGIALIAAMRLDADQRPIVASQPNDPRFRRPASGLYWRVAAPGGELRSRSLWDGTLPAPPAPASSGWTVFNAAGAFEDRVVIVSRAVQRRPDSPRLLVQVAADRQPVAQARIAFGKETALFLTVLWLALAAAAWIQVRMGLRPLDRIRKQLEGMTRTIDARLAVADHPVEIRPLTDAINSVADRRSKDIVRARHRAQDLAHALKTPLTALRLQIEALPANRGHDMMKSLSLVSAAVENELARTGASSEGASVDAAAAIDRIMAVFARTPDGARVALHNRVPPGFAIPMGMEAALEALGAIMENATRHARTSVEVLCVSETERKLLLVRDDGPGIPQHRQPAALERGARLDERKTGQGLGLAIAREIVEASGGALSLANEPAGGLSVALAWPSRQDQTASR